MFKYKLNLNQIIKRNYTICILMYGTIAYFTSVKQDKPMFQNVLV